MYKSRILAAAAVLGVVAACAPAVPYAYTDWHTIDTNGDILGTITLADASTVDLRFSGAYSFVQLTSGTYFYTQSLPPAYESSQVDNAPGTEDIIAIDDVGMHTVTFSRSVRDLVMPLVSVGRPGFGVTYDYSSAPTVLSNGPGYWGNGPLWVSGPNQVTGEEGHGTVYFGDSMSSLSFFTAPSEHWHGFTFGLPSAVPEPGTIAVVGLGLSLVARRRRR